MKRPDLTRYEDRIQKTETCWFWIGATDIRGYGVIARKVDGLTVKFLVHRLVYEDENDVDLSRDIYIHHTCHNRNCVNPEHLEALSPGEHRGEHNKVNASTKDRCPQGHKYTGIKNGQRWCRICSNESSRQSMARKRAREA